MDDLSIYMATLCAVLALAVCALLGTPPLKPSKVPRYRGAHSNILRNAVDLLRSPMSTIRAATETCGNVFSVRTLGVSTVWLRGNGLNKFYLQAREDVWSFEGGMAVFLNKILEDGYWTHYRTLLASVSRYANLSTSQSHVGRTTVAETLAAAERWEAAGEGVRLFNSASEMVGRVIVRSFMGEDFHRHHVVELLQLLHGMEEDVGSPLSLVLPGWVPHPPARRLRRARRRFAEIFRERVAARADDDDKGGKGADYVAYSLRDGLTQGLGDLMPSHHALLLLVAHTSTAASLAWNLVALLRHPDVMARLTHALRREPDSEGASVLLQACIRETMRCYCGARLLRLARKDVRLPGSGMEVPRGSVVCISPYLTHRDPENFEEPDEWRPDRWIAEDGGLIRVEEGKYMPFGAGSHRCVGEKLASIMVSKALAALLGEYDVDWVRPNEGMDFERLDFDRIGSPWLRGDVGVAIRRVDGGC